MQKTYLKDWQRPGGDRSDLPTSHQAMCSQCLAVNREALQQASPNPRWQSALQTERGFVDLIGFLSCVAGVPPLNCACF